MAYEDTPPPSPGRSTCSKIDTEGINDDIVAGVIGQLEKTGNRPHLIRELATVLSNVSDAVSGCVLPPTALFKNPEQCMLTVHRSANPGALLSSRLSAYMKRPSWSALSPCPLDKELTTIHPRKVYFFLTTLPRQAIPADSSDIINLPVNVMGNKRIISPSISNASVDGDAEAAEERKREALSPSPEVDLSVHELSTGVHDTAVEFQARGIPGGASFPDRASIAREGSSVSQSDNALSHRAASPPLEGDEKEFTQTASSMRMRGMSLDEPTTNPPIEEMTDAVLVDETEEEKVKRNREAAEALFGPHNHPATGMALMSSPLVKPAQSDAATRFIKKENEDVPMQETTSILGNDGMSLTWDTREPEDIQIEDLDDLFGAY